MERVTIIGSGNLAHALWHGWHRPSVSKRHVCVVARSEVHRRLWTDEAWQFVRRDFTMVHRSDMVVLAVKPKDIPGAVKQLLPHLRNQILVSAAAGWDIQRLRDLGVNGPVVRMMPNILAAQGASTTICTFDGITIDLREWVLRVLSDLGMVVMVDEVLMDPYTAILGSGPAYILLLLQSLIDSGIQLGGHPATTRLLVSSMVEGTARMVKDRPSEALMEWIVGIASPGGTTEALLAVLKEARWPETIQTAVMAAAERATILGSVVTDR